MKEQELAKEREKADTEKIILDACCGGRHFWFDKSHPNAIFMDIRQERKGSIKVQPNWCVEPDIIGDYREMGFKDKSFKLVVWDIPHKLRKDSGLICKKYGFLGEEYKNDLRLGFNEIMRVLDDYGILVFKYADIDVPVKEVLSLFPQSPLFGTITKKGVNNTYWLIFMKFSNLVGIENLYKPMQPNADWYVADKYARSDLKLYGSCRINPPWRNHNEVYSRRLALKTRDGVSG